MKITYTNTNKKDEEGFKKLFLAIKKAGFTDITLENVVIDVFPRKKSIIIKADLKSIIKNKLGL